MNSKDRRKARRAAERRGEQWPKDKNRFNGRERLVIQTRAGPIPVDELCGCGHPIGLHRISPQRGCCPAPGCTCTGFHMPGADMPDPRDYTYAEPDKEERPTIRPRRKRRMRAQTLALLAIYAAVALPMPGDE